VITGIGIDMVHVNRMEKWRQNQGLLERFFHPEELAQAMSKGKGANMSLAARFAAKEAFGKALGSGLEGIVLKDIMVKNGNNGRPEIFVSGTALSALEGREASRVHLSLTHEKDSAVAMVVIEHEV
jgi:holo-[acyl-carrier protein] synthase